MVDVVEGLARANPSSAYSGIVAGYVSSVRPAPRSFDDPVWVVVPEYSTERPFGPCAWPAIHGNTLPAAGASAWIAFDTEGAPLVISWEGTHS